MAKPKNKKTLSAAIVVTSEEAMIGLLNRMVELQTDITTEQAAHDNYITQLNSVHEEAVQPKRQELATLESSIHLYATNYRETLFTDDKKSKDYANATIGFRDNPSSVGKVVKGDTEEIIAMRLEGQPWGEQFVRWDIALDKKALLAARGQITPEQLALVGIKFVSDEKFFIDPKPETADRITKEAQVAV